MVLYLQREVPKGGGAMPNRTVWWNPHCVDLLTYEAVWSGEQVHVCHVITREVEVDAANWNLRGQGQAMDVLFSFNIYPC